MAHGDRNEDHWRPAWRIGSKDTPIESEPPIVRRVTLPSKVSIAYLAELTGRDLSATISELYDLRLFLGIYRSLDFEEASIFLRRHGIGAEREPEV
jgi:hypothetical protein